MHWQIGIPVEIYASVPGHSKITGELKQCVRHMDRLPLNQVLF